jgi:hypothetical protein
MLKQFKLLSDETQWHLFKIRNDLHHKGLFCETCNPTFDVELTPDEIIKIQKYFQEESIDKNVTSLYKMDIFDYDTLRCNDCIEKKEEIEKYIAEMEGFKECLEELPVLCPKCNSEKIWPEGYIFEKWSCKECGFIFAGLSEETIEMVSI